MSNTFNIAVDDREVAVDDREAGLFNDTVRNIKLARNSLFVGVVLNGLMPISLSIFATLSIWSGRPLVWSAFKPSLLLTGLAIVVGAIMLLVYSSVSRQCESYYPGILALLEEVWI